MKKIDRVGRIPAWVVLGVCLFAGVVNAQNAVTKSSDYFNIYELGAYTGWTHYAKVNAGLGTQLSNSAIGGLRFGVNPFEHFGLEANYQAYSTHDLKFFTPVAGSLLPHVPMHVYNGAINGLLYFTDRESRVRPFVTIGFGFASYSLTGDAKNIIRATPPAQNLSVMNSDTAVQMNYGAGVKWQVHPRIGFRADVRGLLGPQPNFGLSSLPSSGAYIPTDHNHYQQGVETTVGMTFYFGKTHKAPPPETCETCDCSTSAWCRANCEKCKPKPPDEPPNVITGGNISADPSSVCPGDSVSLRANARDTLQHRLSYRWSVDGQVQGGDGPTLSYTPNNSGDHSVGLVVSDTSADRRANAVTVDAVTVHVRQYSQPTVSLTAAPTDVERGGRVTLHATGNVSECGGTLSYRWAASEGSVSGSGQDTSFDSGTVSFNEADRSRPQSKQVRITASVTDSKGGSASSSASVNVNFGARVDHFGDIVFPKGSARVNNCGKRVLIEQLFPVLNSNANYDVVLVGHIDESEVPKGKGRAAKTKALDRERVLQTAGVLSGGGGTCSSLDRSRIRGAWVGTAQESEIKVTSCSISTAPPNERKASVIKDPNEAKNRRVEIWLVPKGMDLPPAARNASSLPEAEMTRVGCPK